MWKPPPQEKFGDFYDKKDKIATGATGTVYKCVSKSDGTDYAVKICPAYEMVTCLQIRKEIEICQLLDHDNIIKLIQSFESLRNFYMVFELMEDGDVCDDIVKRAKYTEYDASIVIEQVLMGVTYLHSKLILHRDLKPENLLLRRIGDKVIVKITDFGSAVKSAIIVREFILTITTSYCAPEIFLQRPYWLPVDIWSCGVILYVALLGILPFCGDTEKELIDNIKRGKYSFPDDDDYAPICDEAKDLIGEMLDLDPKNRYMAVLALSHPFITDRDSVASRVHRSRTIENMKVYNEVRRSKSEELPQPWRMPLDPPPQSKSEGALVSHTLGPDEKEQKGAQAPIEKDDQSVPSPSDQAGNASKGTE